jgi:CDP-diacylglycerol---serine O-phosphatidyltransferase
VVPCNNSIDPGVSERYNGDMSATPPPDKEAIPKGEAESPSPPPTALNPLRRKPLLDPDRRRKGIYILPNLFTSGALFFGFYAIVQGMERHYNIAAIAIFIAMVLDGLDGRVARLTRTQSAFGAQYDSLADMVSFGAAPALVMYVWALQPLGKWGWLAAFIYCACAALRLARFNTQLDIADKRFFTGLPSPAAASLVAGMIWVLHDYRVAGHDIAWFAWVVTVFAGLTMVSNVKYYSGKDINLRRSVPFGVVLAIPFAAVVITSEPSHVLWAIFVLYALSGYAYWVYEHTRRPA